MRYFLIVVLVTTLSSICNSQTYYNFGLKIQRVNFLSVYTSEGTDYYFDPELNDWVLGEVQDSIQLKFLSYGPTLCYGYNFEVTDRFFLAAEIEGYFGLLNVKKVGPYYDFGLGVHGAYVLDYSSYSNVFFRLGAGLGLSRSYEDNNVVGINWRLGYEHDLDRFLVGVALDGNVFLEDLAYSYLINQENLIYRRLNSIGLVVYCSLGKFN